MMDDEPPENHDRHLLERRGVDIARPYRQNNERELCNDGPE